MTRSKQTNIKREKEKKRQKKKQEKAERRIERQSNSNKGKGLDAMIAYVDDKGNLSDMPADPLKKEEIGSSESLPGARKEEQNTASALLSHGKVSYYNEQKGYGFIKDSVTKGTVFFYIASLPGPVKLNDMLSYKVIKGPRGTTAENITKTG